MRVFGHIRKSLWAALPFVFASLPVMAEEAGDKAGLPQLDASLYPEQLFWLAVTFSALYILMSKVALPRVVKTQENRRSIIAAEVEAARLANDQALSMAASADKALHDARAKAQDSVSDMITKVTEEANERYAAQEREAHRALHSAEAEIAVTREAALKQIQGSAETLAKEIVAKVLSPKERVRV